jgi:hypothetical protein
LRVYEDSRLTNLTILFFIIIFKIFKRFDRTVIDRVFILPKSKRGERQDRRKLRSDNEYYPFRIKSAAGGK